MNIFNYKEENLIYNFILSDNRIKVDRESINKGYGYFLNWFIYLDYDKINYESLSDDSELTAFKVGNTEPFFTEGAKSFLLKLLKLKAFI